MSYTANITKARKAAGGFMLVKDAFARLRVGSEKIFLGPSSTHVLTGTISRLGVTAQGYCTCRDLYRTTAGAVKSPLPLRMGDVLEYEVKNGNIYLLAIRRIALPPPPATPTPTLAVLGSSSGSGGLKREDLLQHLIRKIDTDPWKRMYRKKHVGVDIYGWSQRLYNYGLVDSPLPTLPTHLYSLHSIRNASIRYNPSKLKTHLAGLALGEAILAWGGVTKDNLVKLPMTLAPVVRSARIGRRVGGAPMNSGWTKIAAVFNYHDTGGHSSFRAHKPQVIWDSRVSYSVCQRLIDAAMHFKLTPKQLLIFFPTLGWVGGRGGRRPVRGWFPSGYGKWDAHFAGGEIALEIAQLLNRCKSFPCSRFNQQQMDEFDAKSKAALKEWTPWLVACVLFMDGQ